MIAYKGMCPGMVCLGYQLKMGLNVTEQANCQGEWVSLQRQTRWTACAIMGIFRTRNTIWFVRAAIWMRMR